MEADVCVVGSGLAGILLSLELARRGREVVLLEAGGPRPERHLVEAQRGDTTDADHEGLDQVSTRRLGGAMALWGGRLLPLDPEDFTARPGRPESWPISYEDLLPHYRQAHSLLDAGAYEYTADEALGAPQSPLLLPPAAGTSFDSRRVWRWCPPLRFKHFKDQIEAQPRIRLIHHALVVRLDHDSGGMVDSAQVSGRPGHVFRVRARQFVLAGGGLETTRLLLSSTGRRETGLGNGAGQVGRRYTTHPVAEVGELRVTPHVARKLCSFETSHDGVYSRRFLSVLPEVRERHGLLNMNVTFWSPDPHDPAHGDGLLSAYAIVKRSLIKAKLTDKTAGAHRSHLDRPAQLRAHARNIVRTAPSTVGQLAVWTRRRWLADRQVPALVSAGRQGTVRLRFDAEQRSESRNGVQLSRERDAFGMPRLKLAFAVGEDDRASYYRTLELLQQDVQRTGAGTLALPTRAEFDQLRLGDGTHQMGLLRMSADPTDGVVDRNCKLHESPNTYVLSTGVFPTAGAAPPTLTLAALAVRLGEHLARPPV